jgi:glycosyltransferase involved in cell wall biosynthesis
MVPGNHAATRPRVLALTPEEERIGAVTLYRITGPLSYLMDRGYPVAWMDWNQARQRAIANPGSIGQYDVVITARTADWQGLTVAFFARLRAMGKVVVYETDDDYTNEYRKVINGDAIAVAKQATIMTTSTPELRAQMLKHTGPKPTYVLRNCIDFALWDSTPTRRIVPGTTIGLVGTKTHEADWRQVSDALHRIGEERDDVNFVLGGYRPDYLADLPRLYYSEPVIYTEYPNLCAQIDIGLCPLVADDPFNISKSAIKALEYWAAGAAVVASGGPVYSRVMDSDRGFLAKTDSDWYTAITTLLDDPARRKAMAGAGRTWTWRNRNMAYNCEFWWDVYDAAFKEYGGKIDVRTFNELKLGYRPPKRKGDHRSNVPQVPLAKGKRRRR